MTNVELLLTGIVKQAAKDYVDSLKTLLEAKKNKTLKSKETCEAYKLLKECTRFFRSKAFNSLLPEIDSNEFIEKLNRRVINEVTKK